MTGPEHYLEAERLLAGAQNVMEVAPIDGLTNTECATLAQVHATLALVAATALSPYGEDEPQAWVRVCAVPTDSSDG